MSDEPKKYPANTPVTLEMLAEVMKKAVSPQTAIVVQGYIESPKPDPKEGELWLCKNDLGHMTAIWRLSGGWAYWDDGAGTPRLRLTPIKRLIPPEDKA